MKQEELIAKMREWHQAELKDAQSYKEAAKDALELGYRHANGVLMDIAHEEETHANIIEHMLEKL